MSLGNGALARPLGPFGSERPWRRFGDHPTPKCAANLSLVFRFWAWERPKGEGLRWWARSVVAGYREPGTKTRVADEAPSGLAATELRVTGAAPPGPKRSAQGSAGPSGDCWRCTGRKNRRTGCSSRCTCWPAWSGCRCYWRRRCWRSDGVRSQEERSASNRIPWRGLDVRDPAVAEPQALTSWDASRRISGYLWTPARF